MFYKSIGTAYVGVHNGELRDFFWYGALVKIRIENRFNTFVAKTSNSQGTFAG